MTLGGATPADSPFLRRPDLLRSLVTYWQHHPALSYLFAGLFIGGTSQAPRVDEGGTVPFAELGQSLAEIERAGAPGVVDRVLRSFLADPTGNTHRTEFSIDKLWSSDSASGRQGLVELRAFEMPPHARMSLVQMLLLRALIARFWKAPYRHPPAEWGEALHDRFLLPHFVWDDAAGVAAELMQAGYAFDAAWLLPFFEFRFPVCGRAAYDGVELELRMGLEPWLVLGEETIAHRQSRVVDSTMERVQVTCRGLDPARHVVTCNGRRLPLARTAEEGTFIAGIRYKAWSDCFALHPTIAAHGPLVIDLVDRRLGRAVGGCVYHVTHPGGRAYATDTGQRLRGGSAPHEPLLSLGARRRCGVAAGLARATARAVSARRRGVRAGTRAGALPHVGPPTGRARMTRVALTHVIEERYARPVRLSTHWLRLRPVAHTHADVTAYSLRVRTEPHFVNWMRDAFENHVARVDFPEPVCRLRIEVDVVATIADVDPFDFLLDDDAIEHPFAYHPQLRRELAPYLQLEPPGPQLTRWLARLPRARCATVERVRQVVTAVHEQVAVDATGARELERVLAYGAGTPATLAWLAVVSLRSLRLAARVTSGYRVSTANGDVAAALHTWAEVFLPGAGWIGVDPSAGLFTDAAWVPLACAPDPTKVQALAGFREASECETSETLVAHRLVPVAPETPYSEAEWAAIGAVGRAVDADLAAANVALGVARELAFVSTADGDQPEWRTTALGASKRDAADALVAGLRRRLAPGAVVTCGDGEWFAGEPGPRWRLACVWRCDGRPVWRGAGSSTAASPETFGRALVDALDVPTDALCPAYEDPLCGMRAEAVPPDDVRDPDRRRALAERSSEERLGPLVGWVVPLAWDDATERWRSSPWTFRRRRLYLMPGTLPMGVRLPLASLPPDERAAADDPARCPFAPSGPLPDMHAEPARRREPMPSTGPSPRTAVCIEVRDARLHVFLPPLARAEPYLRLVAAIEAAAEQTNATVVLEGYEAPEDARLQRIVLEPAPGSLRVALPATTSTGEHAALLEAVYAEAAGLGLHATCASAEGTPEPIAACAPVVLGGATPVTSPLLARPSDPAGAPRLLAAPSEPLVSLPSERAGGAGRTGAARRRRPTGRARPTSRSRSSACRAATTIRRGSPIACCAICSPMRAATRGAPRSVRSGCTIPPGPTGGSARSPSEASGSRRTRARRRSSRCS